VHEGGFLALDVAGPRKLAASTTFGVLHSSGDLAIRCMVCLDGLGYGRWEARDAAATDAALSEQREDSNRDGESISTTKFDIMLSCRER